jgi:hypothetical protein
MHIGPDVLVRVGLGVFGVLLLRDGYAGLQRRQLWVLKGNWIILEGWKSQLAGLYSSWPAPFSSSWHGLVFLSLARRSGA